MTSPVLADCIRGGQTRWAGRVLVHFLLPRRPQTQPCRVARVERAGTHTNMEFMVQNTTKTTQVAKVREDEGVQLISCCTHPEYGRHILRSLELGPKQAPIGMVIFVHGTFQHSRSVELDDLQQRVLDLGCMWFGLDAPGHGMSGRLGDPSSVLAPAMVPDMDAYLEDLLFYIVSVAEERPSLPVILMCHSWGSAIVAMMLPRLEARLGSQRLRGACFSSCSAIPIGLPDPRTLTFVPELKLRWNAFLTPEGLGTTGGGRLDIKKTVRDPSLRDRVANDRLRYHQAERPFLSELSWQLGEVYKRGGQQVPHITVPLCIHTGSADKAVSPLCGPNLYCHSKTPTSAKQFTLLPDGAHNLFADPHRTILMDDWVAFVKRAIQGEFLAAPP